MINRKELDIICNEYEDNLIKNYKESYEKYIDNYLIYNYIIGKKFCNISVIPEHSDSLTIILEKSNSNNDYISFKERAYNLSKEINDSSIIKKASLEVIKLYLNDYYIRGIRVENSDTEVESHLIFYFDDPDDGYGHTFYIYEHDKLRNTKVWVPEEYNTKEKVDKKPWYKKIFKL